MRHIKRIGDEKIGNAFQRTAMRIEGGRRLRVGGLLTPAGAHRRCQLVELPRESSAAAPDPQSSQDSTVHLRVRGDAMTADGIQDGDYLVLDSRARSLRQGQTVLADVGGCTVVRRVTRDAEGEVRLEALQPAADASELPLLAPTGRACIHGAVVGILRKELRSRRLRALQSSLRVVRSTYRTTEHPRLRRALRAEAALLSREMAREWARLDRSRVDVAS